MDQMIEYMPTEMFKELRRFTRYDGPFTFFEVDSKFLPSLLDWIDNDWEKFREVLNYVHERGQRRGIALARNSTTDILNQVIHREQTVSQLKLTGKRIVDGE